MASRRRLVLFLACDGYRPARRTLFAPRRQYPYGHPRHGAAAGKASEKIRQADALIVEADISGNETPFSNLPTYPPLAERLSDTQLSELEARAGELGLSVGLFDSQPLWQVAMVLQATQAQKLGLRPDYGIDYQLLMAARESNIAVMELEGADSQIALLRDLPDGGWRCWRIR